MKKQDDKGKSHQEINRREFIKTGAAYTAAGLAPFSLFGNMSSVMAGGLKEVAKPLDSVKVGIVGVGHQGSGHVKNLLKIEGVELKAVCDLVPDRVKRMQNWAKEAGRPEPKGYDRSQTDFLRMCDDLDLDLVLTATPWKWHVPICLNAMKTGSHVATEVPAAWTIDQCWQLVETAEDTGKHCVMLENVCYFTAEMMILNMVRKGLFGELLHAEGAYNHDLRNLKLSTYYQDSWRIKHSINRNGNLYPTHGLGPIAQCMNINRGDRFDYLVSMSSPSRGLKEYAREHLGPDHVFSKTEYLCGDVNTSLLKTIGGKTIYLVHDTNLPRPYSRINMLQGTKGITRGFCDMTHGNLVHIEGKSPAHKWQPLSDYEEAFEHPMIRQIRQMAEGAGHGGADFIEDYRLVNAIKRGVPTDMDVYDAADWSVVSGLTESSVANRSRPVDFPDFTRGKWKSRLPLPIIPDKDQ